MQHGCKLNSQFARRMDGHAKLKCFANSRRLHAWTNAAPESCVQQDHIDGSIQNVGCELLEVYHYRVCRQRQAHFLAHAPHSVHSEDGIFQIVIAYSSICCPNQIAVSVDQTPLRTNRKRLPSRLEGSAP